MASWIPDWIRGEKRRVETGRESGRGKYPALEDVIPLHPEDYPARHLKERLDARRDMLDEIEDRGSPMGLPDGHGPVT